MARPKKWTLEALDPHDPTGVGTREVWIDQAHLESLTRGNLAPRFYRVLLVPEIVRNPAVVFEGWERAGHEDDLCYAGIPSTDFRTDTIQVPPPPGKTFLVFVTRRGRVTKWRWEDADPDQPEYPENWRTRFRRIVWPTNPTT